MLEDDGKNKKLMQKLLADKNGHVSYHPVHNPCCLIYLLKEILQIRLLHVGSVDQNLMCPIKFHFSMFSWTFLIAYSKAKLKTEGNKGSFCFRLFIHYRNFQNASGSEIEQHSYIM
jgi:hypothetical protein